MVVLTLLRAVGSTIGLVAIYYLMPLDPSSLGVTVGLLAFGLVALAGLIVFQVRSIIRATHPAHAGGRSPLDERSTVSAAVCRDLFRHGRDL